MNINRKINVDIKKPASYRYDEKLPADSAMLEELLKETDIQQLFESYYNLISIPVAIIDLNANVLLSSRWQRICTQFHRVHPTACGRCIESDTKLATQLQDGQTYTIYACRNGLTDCASPIIIEEKHIANLFIGQFLTKEPDETWFRKQAEEFGFDVDDYLAALREVPVVEAERIPVILDLLSRMTRVITNLGIDRKSAVEIQARQSIILNTIPQSVFWKDLHGRYLGCNVPFARAAGLATPDDIVGKTDFDLPWPRNEAEAYRADDLAVISANRSRLHIIEPLQQADGSRIVIDTSKIPLADASNTPFGVVGIYEDITERKKAEEEIRRNESRMMALLELNKMTNSALQDITNFALEEAIRLTESKIGYLAFLNEDETILTMYSWSKIAMEECQISDKPIIYPVETTGLWGEAVRQRRPIITDDYEAPNPWKKGYPEGHVHVTRHMNAPVFEGKRIVLVAGVGNKTESYNESDVNQLTLLMEGMWRIIQRQRVEDKLYRLNRELQAISECNRTLVRADNEKALLDQICAIACEKAGYRMAWVGYAEQDEAKTVRPVAWAGTEDGYVSTAKISWADTERGRGPTGTAIRNAETVYIQDFETDSRMAPWRDNALRLGYRSSIALPLKYKSGAAFGAFTLYSSEPDAFTPDEIRLLEELTDDLAFGINVLRARKEQERAEEALRASEDRYRTLFETANDAIFLMDGKTFIDCNFKAVEMFGCRDKSEIIGRPPEEFSPARQPDGENSLGKAREYIAAALNGTSQRFPWRHCRKDGTAIDAEVSLNSLSLRGKDFLLALVRDITERKRTEKDLVDSERRFRTLFEQAAVGVAQIDPISGRFFHVNKRYCDIVGLSLDEMLKTNFQSITHPDDLEADLRNMKSMIAGEINEFSMDKRYIKKDGCIVWVHLTVYPTWLPDESPNQHIAIVEDITERKQAEAALRESETKYRLLVEGTNDIVYSTSAEGVLTYVSPQVARYGWVPEELISKSILLPVHEGDRERVAEEFREVVRSGKEIISEFRIHSKSGEIIWFFDNGKVQRDAQGNILGTSGILINITERKQSEKKMLSLQAQLQQSQKMEAIGRLAGGVAHDFNNLLTVISIQAQLALRELQKSDPLKEKIKDIEQAADRAANLTRQLLAFSRRQILEMKVVNLNIILEDMEKMLRRVIGEDIDIKTVFVDDLGMVKVDPGQIEQVVMNLVVNARDAMLQGGKLFLETANVELDKEYTRFHAGLIPGAYVMLSITDTGIGMTKEVRNQIFDPFFTTKAKGKGTGLGLSTVYGIVKQSGGDIYVYSEPGKGTTFKIYLPRVFEPPEELKKEAGEEISRGTETILVVEDDGMVRKLAINILRNQGYTVLEAEAGEEALVVCDQYKEPIHLILTDVVMPHMSGAQFIERLKQVRKNFKVLYMSGYTDEAIVHHGVLEKEINLISKPFTIEKLDRKVREVLDKNSESSV